MRTAWNTAARNHSMVAKRTSISAYLASLEPERRREFERLRAWVRKVLPNAKETMAYKMPTYEGREPICSIAAQKRHFALYVCELDVLDQYRDDFAALDVGKGCIRFAHVADLPRTAARKLLRAAARELG